jgi:hypothetical protein
VAQYSAAVADALAWALHRSGDSSSALQYATQAVETGGHNAAYLAHLGAIQQALNDDVSARRNLGEALLTNPHFSPVEGPAAKEALDLLGGPPSDVSQAMEPALAPTPVAKPEPAKPRPAAPAPQQQAPANTLAGYIVQPPAGVGGTPPRSRSGSR